MREVRRSALLDEVTGHDHVRVRQVDDQITGGVATSRVAQDHPPATHQQHLLGVHGAGG